MMETRGDRLKAVREALGLKQDEMAALLEREAAKRGIRSRYSNTEVSRMEKGRSPIDVDDLVIYAALDPERRGIGWLATGEREVVTFAVPATATRSGRPATARELGLEAPAPRKKSGGR